MARDAPHLGQHPLRVINFLKVDPALRKRWLANCPSARRLFRSSGPDFVVGLVDILTCAWANGAMITTAPRYVNPEPIWRVLCDLIPAAWRTPPLT